MGKWADTDMVSSQEWESGGDTDMASSQLLIQGTRQQFSQWSWGGDWEEGGGVTYIVILRSKMNACGTDILMCKN